MGTHFCSQWNPPMLFESSEQRADISYCDPWKKQWLLCIVVGSEESDKPALTNDIELVFDIVSGTKAMHHIGCLPSPLSLLLLNSRFHVVLAFTNVPTSYLSPAAIGWHGYLLQKSRADCLKNFWSLEYWWKFNDPLKLRVVGVPATNADFLIVFLLKKHW